MQKLEPEVDVLVDLQLSDLLRANLWFWYSKPSSKFSLAVTPILMVLFAVFIFSKELPALYALIPLGLLILEAFILLVIIVETKRNYSTVKEFQRKIHYHLKREGYTASDGKSSSNVSWESVLRAVESRKSFNLFLGRTIFAVIPKKFFKTTADVEITRDILKTALGEKAQLR
jgi:hypothetical protein